MLFSNSPTQTGVKKATNFAWGEGTKSSGCSGSESKVSGSSGVGPPPSTASCFFPHCPAPRGLPPQRARPSDSTEGSTAQKGPSTKQAGSEQCQSKDRVCGNIKSGHYSGQDPGKEGVCPYLETSKGKELAVNKRSGPPGKRTYNLERAETQSVCGQSRGSEVGDPATAVPPPASRVEATHRSSRRTEARKGPGTRPGDVLCSHRGQPLLAVPRREQAPLEGSPVQRH